jgi:hypothetical protein
LGSDVLDSGISGSGVLGKISGVRVIHALTALEYTSAHYGSQMHCGFGCVETSQPMN